MLRRRATGEVKHLPGLFSLRAFLKTWQTELELKHWRPLDSCKTCRQKAALSGMRDILYLNIATKQRMHLRQANANFINPTHCPTSGIQVFNLGNCDIKMLWLAERHA